MKNFNPIILAMLLLFIVANTQAQITYTTATNGSWSSSSTWDANGVPPNKLPSSDFIIIRHSVTFDVNQEIMGSMTIQASGSITTGGNHDLKIGKGAINQGELFNYGSISIDKLEVKPNNGCTPTIVLPRISNHGTVNVEDLHIGNNCGAGSFFNYASGTVSVNDEMHLDNYLWNENEMTISNKLKNHGGTIDGCGTIYTPYLDIDQNTSRPGTFSCINICQSGGGEPTIDVDGDVYTDYIDAYRNAPSDEAVFHITDTYLCGSNSQGGSNLLPVELNYFIANLKDRKQIQLEWETVSEIDNDYFLVERSKDGKNWEALETVKGAGNSNYAIKYATLDPSPFMGTNYYRLKQVDLDGIFEYSSVVVVQIEREITNEEAHIYPNPTNGILNIEFKAENTGEVKIFNTVGIKMNNIGIEKTGGNYGLRMDLSNLSAGLYLIKTETAVYKIYKK